LLSHTVLWAQRAGYWQQAVDYRMDIDVDTKNYQYQGEMVLKYTNNSPQALEKDYFHLYFNAFQPGSMMDHRLAHIPDPDPRMPNRTGTAERPTTPSRIAKLKPAHIGYQHIQSLTMNGQATTFQVDGTLREVTLP